ncbi:amidophosphoribosyltransferase [Neorickettsia helminthoeca]|nr:amidophosphoribosyltransferase [Neorickettsia helminthoeca]
MKISDQAKLQEKCGVICVTGVPDAAELCLTGLHALQHRGHEAFGVASSVDGKINVTHRLGTVMANSADVPKCSSDKAIGHVRYSTSGNASFSQPVYLRCPFGEIAIAHNGNLINADELREILKKRGCIFESDVDTEVLVHLLALSKEETYIGKITEALQQVKGAYSLVLLINNEVFAVRDPHGVRPLSLGRLGDAIVITSETCALDILKATFVRDVAPGELLEIKTNDVISHFPLERKERKFCIFEYVYFSRPDSLLEGRSVYTSRKKIGMQLAHESNTKSDMVVPVLDSGMVSSIGYAETSGIPLELAITKNYYSGRSFIEPTQDLRRIRVKLKHNANRELLQSKKIILIDDSIVRGTTLKLLIAMLWEAGTEEIHVKIASPRMMNPCYYGVDTPNKKDLISANLSVEEVRKYLGATSLYFLSLEGLYKAVSGSDVRKNFCDACFTGDYPIK